MMERKTSGWREVRTAAALGEVRQENPALVWEKDRLELELAGAGLGC